MRNAIPIAWAHRKTFQEVLSLLLGGLLLSVGCFWLLRSFKPVHSSTLFQLRLLTDEFSTLYFFHYWFIGWPMVLAALWGGVRIAELTHTHKEFIFAIPQSRSRLLLEPLVLLLVVVFLAGLLSQSLHSLLTTFFPQEHIKSWPPNAPFYVMQIGKNAWLGYLSVIAAAMSGLLTGSLREKPSIAFSLGFGVVALLAFFTVSLAVINGMVFSPGAPTVTTLNKSFPTWSSLVMCALFAVLLRHWKRSVPLQTPKVHHPLYLMLFTMAVFSAGFAMVYFTLSKVGGKS